MEVITRLAGWIQVPRSNTQHALMLPTFLMDNGPAANFPCVTWMVHEEPLQDLMTSAEILKELEVVVDVSKIRGR